MTTIADSATDRRADDVLQEYADNRGVQLRVDRERA